MARSKRKRAIVRITLADRVLSFLRSGGGEVTLSRLTDALGRYIDASRAMRGHDAMRQITIKRGFRCRTTLAARVAYGRRRIIAQAVHGLKVRGLVELVGKSTYRAIPVKSLKEGVRS